jgi:FKBP-type peptidyl-prolyl cis-trans isomerase 2
MAIITKVEEQNGQKIITVDTNHQLAGETLIIHLELLEIDPNGGLPPESDEELAAALKELEDSLKSK